MIVCRQCGTRNAAGSQFCGECGAFLEWEGDRDDPAPEPTPPPRAPEPPPTPAPTWNFTRPEPRQAERPGPTPAPATGTAPDPGTASAPTPGTGPAPIPGSGQGPGTAPTPGPGPSPRPAQRPERRPGAESRAEPPPDQWSPPPVRPTERQPTDEPTRRPTRHEPEDRPLLRGESPCPSCGAGNDPTRRFCRRCGVPLTAAPVAARPTFWQRLLGWVFPRRVHAAGDRPNVRRPIRWRRPVLLLAALLTLVTVASAPGLRSLPGKGLAAVLDRTTKPAAVVPSAARASGSAAGTSPERLYDGKSDTYWAPAGPLPAWVEVDFAKPFRLVDVIVTPGVSAEQKAFVADARPAVLTVEVTDGAGRVTTLTWQVRDAPGGQTFPARVSDARRVRLTITTVFGPANRPAAVAELEFYGR
ncbi:discoidin domain-containing protein [Longispora sp. K20-0274]|uniref:NADase-type glycan-binding domain-containing protein n=1 Tax=Longispora sp. K20-0274 TaxID=3088255 RepID=UPI00399AF06C